MDRDYEDRTYADLQPYKLEPSLPRGSQTGTSNRFGNSEFRDSEDYYQYRRNEFRSDRRVEDMNEHETPRRPYPDPNNPKVPAESLHARLLRTIDSKGTFNCFVAGEAVMEAFTTGFPDSELIVDQFVRENASRIRTTKTPEMWRLADDHYYKKLSYATFLNGKIAVEMGSKHHSDLEEHKGKHTMAKIGGSAENFTKVFYYPTTEPFSGKPIKVGVLPRNAEEGAHIIMKRLLVAVLAKSCTFQPDIAQLWSVSEDGEPNKHRMFPCGFYRELKELCTQFFGFHHEELRFEWRDEYISLDFLKFHTAANRETRFRKLKESRTMFENGTYHYYLKEALRELRYGEFLPKLDGEEYQRFVPRQRYIRKEPKDRNSSTIGFPVSSPVNTCSLASVSQSTSQTDSRPTIPHPTIPHPTVSHSTISHPKVSHSTISQSTLSHPKVSHSTVSQSTVASLERAVELENDSAIRIESKKTRGSVAALAELPDADNVAVEEEAAITEPPTKQTRKRRVPRRKVLE